MKRALAGVAFVLAAAALVYAWRQGRSAVGVDFYQFWAGSQIARDVDDLYAQETRASQYRPFTEAAWNRGRSERMLVATRLRNEFEFFSTPFLYTTFAPLPDSYEPAFLIYRIVSLAALAGGVLLLARAAGLGWGPAALILAFVLTLFEPVKTDIRVGNVNHLQLFVIALAVWVARGEERWRAIATGALLALVTAFKPNLAPVLPLLLAYRLIARDRAKLVWEAIGGVGGAAVAVIVSSIYFRGFGAWLEWLAAARSLATTLLPLSQGNVTPVLRLANAYGAGATYIVAAVLAAIVIFAMIRSRSGSALTVVALALLIYLLSATLVWTHYLVLALPAAIALIAEPNWRRALGILGLTLVGLDVWLFLGVQHQRSTVLVVWTGLAVLFIGCVIRTLWPYAASYEANDRRTAPARPRPSRPNRR